MIETDKPGIRKSAVAGRFYPQNSEELLENINDLIERSGNEI